MYSNLTKSQCEPVQFRDRCFTWHEIVKIAEPENGARKTDLLCSRLKTERVTLAENKRLKNVDEKINVCDFTRRGSDSRICCRSD